MLTQRLIMIIISINLIIGFVDSINDSPTTWNSNQIGTEIDLMEEQEAEFESEEGVWGSVKSSEDRIYENTIGSPIKWGWVLLKTFTRALNPFSFSPSDFETDSEKALAWVLTFFRCLMIMLVSIEGYMFFKNKKNS